jgi:hypothetical protein
VVIGRDLRLAVTVPVERPWRSNLGWRILATAFFEFARPIMRVSFGGHY